MAEFVVKDLVKKAGLEKEFQIASAASSTEEIGHPVYPPARCKLAEVHGRFRGDLAGCAGRLPRAV